MNGKKKGCYKFNPSKIKPVLFSMKKNTDPSKLFCQHCQLEYVTVHRHLGLSVPRD